MVSLKFKNVVSFLGLYKILQKKNFVKIEYISLIFPPFFPQLKEEENKVCSVFFLAWSLEEFPPL